MAVGVRPATDFLKESGFALERDGSLSVDEYLRVPGKENVYAIGMPGSSQKFVHGISRLLFASF